MALGYAGIFLAAWNLEFPSTAECLLWRICTAVTLGLTFITGVVEILLAPPSIVRDLPHNYVGEEAPQRDIDHGVFSASAETATSKTAIVSSTILPSFTNRQRNQRQAMQTPAEKIIFKMPSKTITRFNLPLHSILVTELTCAIYCVCRLCIIVEDIIGLRALPASTFQNVDWAAYWPHI